MYSLARLLFFYKTQHPFHTPSITEDYYTHLFGSEIEVLVVHWNDGTHNARCPIQVEVHLEYLRSQRCTLADKDALPLCHYICGKYIY